MQKAENQVDSSSSIRILAEGLSFPEGPAFDAQGNLWCVELKGGNLIEVKTDGQFIRHATNGMPNGLCFDSMNRAWVCDSKQMAVRRFEPTTGTWDTIADTLEGERLNKPNDLAFDQAGNLVFTCPGDSRHEPTGYVCCVLQDGTIKKIATGMFFPNGLAFANDGRTLVVAETYRHRLWRGSWDAVAAEWRDARPWADVSGAPGPDGMAFGAAGLLYVAVYGSGQIKAVNEQGRVVETHDVPGANPTNVAFDPLARFGLIVTEAEHGRLLSLPELRPGVRLFNGS